MVACQAAFSERVESVENQTRRTIAGVRSFSDGAPTKYDVAARLPPKKI
jgi:hypothetical protein